MIFVGWVCQPTRKPLEVAARAKLLKPATSGEGPATMPDRKGAADPSNASTMKALRTPNSVNLVNVKLLTCPNIELV